MPARRSRRDEIDELAEEVKARSSRSAKASSASADAEATVSEGIAGTAAEAKALLDELKSRLEDGYDDTRDFTIKNPVTALSAAFLLGLLVGRIWRSS